MTVDAPVRVRTTDEVATAVKDAAARRAPLRIVGRGLWLDAGPPAQAAAPLALDALSGIIAYTPGDLTLTARAGTTLAEIAAVTAEHSQWLALDPFGADDGTLGATVATASCGPLAHAFGTPRDAVLGLEVVTGEGTIIRAGGRVVKNVAGFDLVRLFTGSWGTLGVITEVTVRLRAKPDGDETWAIAVGDDDALDAACRAARTAPMAPLAFEVVDAPLASRLGLGGRTTIVVRLAGAAASLRAQRDALRTLGDAAAAPTTVWHSLRTIEPPAGATLRLSQLPDRLADTWRGAATTTTTPLTYRHATPSRGIVRIVAAPGAEHTLAAIARAAAARCTIIPERFPASLWASVAAPTPNATLAARVRAAFDPRGVLNPALAPQPVANNV